MATKSTNPSLEEKTPSVGAPARQQRQSGASSIYADHPEQETSRRDALQALLALSALHEQARRRRARAIRHNGFGAVDPADEQEEHFVLDEVLQLVAEYAAAITGADGLALALAQGNEIVMCAHAGTVRPDIGECIDRDSLFSGACFRMGQIVSCDDSETDARVNLQACRRLDARSMVAVPLCGRRCVIGVLEVFSKDVFGFNDNDVRNLRLLSELAAGALEPEDENRFSESAQVAAAKLELVPRPAVESTSNLLNGAAHGESTIPAAVGAAKPVEAEVTRAPATKILDEPALEVEKAPEFEETAAGELQAQPEQPDSAHRRTNAFLLLGFIVVAVAFVAGVWSRTARVGSAILQPTRVAVKPASTNARARALTTSPPAPAGKALNPANVNPTALSSAGLATYSRPTLRKLSRFPRVTGIQHWSTAAASSTVVVDIEDQVQYEEHHLADPDRIYLDLHDTQLVPDLAGKSIRVGDALLKRIRVGQPVAGVTRIVLETKVNSTLSVSLELRPCRMVVELHKSSNP